MKLLAVDSSWAGKTGWATFLDGKLLDYGILRPKSVMEWHEQAPRNLMLAACDVLVIEDTFFGRNVATLKKLEQAKCLWTIPARDLYGIKVVEVKPESWMVAICGKRSFKGGSAKDVNAMRFYVKNRWGVEPESIDALSAICLGTYYVDKENSEHVPD